MATKNFRKRKTLQHDQSEDEEEEQHRLALEEVKFLQKQRERKLGIPAHSTAVWSGSGGLRKPGDKGGEGGGDGEKEDLVLQDTFAQETAVTVEDPNMLKYVEQELAKRKGKSIDASNKEENDQVDELYVVPEHLKVKKRNSEESSTQWTTGIAEIQLPIEYKLRNIEETEAAKKLLQEKRLVGRTKSELNIPSSYSADYFQRGQDYAEKLRRERREAREVFLVYGEKSGRGMLQVYDEVNSSGYNLHTEACCFLLESKSEHPENGWEEDGEKAIFAGKLDVGMGSTGFFNEDATSCEVDRLAEGAWNFYFGRNSTWHYMGSVSKDS